MSFHIMLWHAKANNKYIKKDDESKYFLYVEYLNGNNLCREPVLGNYLMMRLNGTKYSNLLKNLSKIINIVCLGILLKLTRNIQNNYNLHVMNCFFPLKTKIGKWDKLFCIIIVHEQNLWEEYKSWSKITKNVPE